MRSIKKNLLIFFVAIATLLLPTYSFAGNNDSLPSYGYTGTGDDLWKYNSNYSGMRISIYWASDSIAFESGEGIIQLGNTTDISKTGPWYKINEYTGYSIYWYMNKDNIGKGRNYDYINSSTIPYTWIGKGEIYNSSSQDIVEKMPDVWNGTKAQWDNWFEGPLINNQKTYQNIPEIASLCGAEISVKDFKDGIFTEREFRSDPGIYKIFFEPVIYPIVDGVPMAMTLRDLIRWEEAFWRSDISTSDGKDLINWITPVFVFTANSQFLIENEPAISMCGKKSNRYEEAYEKTRYQLFRSNTPKADTYKVIYDSPDINVRRQQRAEIKEQLNPLGGIIYNSMGVGVITPEIKADFDIIHESQIVTDKTVEKAEAADTLYQISLTHSLLNGSYTQEDIAKIEYYILGDSTMPEDVVTGSADPAIVLSNPAASPNPSMRVKAGTGMGKKTVLGMKIFFKDGVVYPKESGPTYGDRYVMHHTTFKTLHTESVGYTGQSAGAILRAAPRENESFNVTEGIPSGEALYAQVIADSYLYHLDIRPVSGAISTSVTVEHFDEAGEAKTTEIAVSRPYSYYEITSFTLYSIKDALIQNKALPNQKILLTPKGGYRTPVIEVTHDTEDKYSYHISRGSSNITITSDAVTQAEVRAAAEAAVSSPSVRSDKLVINGKTILDAQTGYIAANAKPGKTSRDVLYEPGLVIPESTANGLYESNGSITYQKAYFFCSQNPETLTFDLNPVNPVFVHTPVYVNLSISSDDAYNQNPAPSPGTSALILGRPFTVDISNSGAHKNIKGYGVKDYTKYIKDRVIRFDFDTYLGADRSGAYLKANTWHSLRSLGIADTTSKITFYTPAWVDVGLYNVEVRNIAANDVSDGERAESKANLNASCTAAAYGREVEVSGRIYDFAITDIDDVSWELFFRKSKNSAESTGKVFYTGPADINGNVSTKRKYFMPVLPGKNDVPGYQSRAVKLGYAFKFEIKTIGNYYTQNDSIQIKPTFAFVDKDGKNRQEVDLYYATARNPFIKIGSLQDTLTQSVKLDLKYRGIDIAEFQNTAGAIYRLRGGMGDYTLNKWIDSFPTLSQSGIPAYNYTEILLSEPLRTFIGPTGNIPAGVNVDKAFASAQKWYGEYSLPSDCLIVPKGTDLSKEKNLTRQSPVFLRNGYLLVNFRNISVIQNKNFDNPNLQYIGRTGDGWVLEGYDTKQGGWQLLKGDVLAYYANMRAADDYVGTGTH